MMALISGESDAPKAGAEMAAAARSAPLPCKMWRRVTVGRFTGPSPQAVGCGVYSGSRRARTDLSLANAGRAAPLNGGKPGHAILPPATSRREKRTGHGPYMAIACGGRAFGRRRLRS